MHKLTLKVLLESVSVIVSCRTYLIVAATAATPAKLHLTEHADTIQGRDVIILDKKCGNFEKSPGIKLIVIFANEFNVMIMTMYPHTSTRYPATNCIHVRQQSSNCVW